MVYLENKINNTFIAGFNELKTMVSDAVASEADLAPSPTAANSSRNDSAHVVEAPVVSPEDEVQSWAELALDAVNRLSDDVERIKWKANRVSFDVLHDYGDQYGFFRLVFISFFSFIHSFINQSTRSKLKIQRMNSINKAHRALTLSVNKSLNSELYTMHDGTLKAWFRVKIKLF